MRRSAAERVFLVVFLPTVLLIYLIKSYPQYLTAALGIADPYGDYFFLFGKQPNFWYQTLYTAVVVGLCLRVLWRGKSPYGIKPGRKPLPKYQRAKFLCILTVQSIGFYFIPFVLPMLATGWSDTVPRSTVRLDHETAVVPLEQAIAFSPTQPKFALLVYVDGRLREPADYTVIEPSDRTPGTHQAVAIEFEESVERGAVVTVTAFHLAHKLAHVYVSPAFLSVGAAAYMFVGIPLFVWFFGKRYCSWVCACGNLAETVGTTAWGMQWVKQGTPRGRQALRWEWVQSLMLVFSVVVGCSAVLNAWRVISPAAHDRIWYVQDFLTDFMFGSLIGVGLYPFFGTRMWCRYGCPMARWMHWFGRFGRSTFAVVPNDKCRGIGACTEACPMGIPVADYAHKERQPIEIAFGLETTPCIGCGGCISACPVNALAFQKVGSRTQIAVVSPEDSG